MSNRPLFRGAAAIGVAVCLSTPTPSLASDQLKPSIEDAPPAASLANAPAAGAVQPSITPVPTVTDRETASLPSAKGDASDARPSTPANETLSGERRGKLPIEAFERRPATILTQTPGVRIGCFPARLTAVLHDISSHFGKPVVVTSGFRSGGRRGSYHRKCMAADIQVAGIAPSAVVRFARAIDAVGGVGAYSHTRSVHVDVGDREFSWFGGKRRTAGLGGGCCPICNAGVVASAQGGSRFACTG